jgi:hypothetical protein
VCEIGHARVVDLEYRQQTACNPNVAARSFPADVSEARHHTARDASTAVSRRIGALIIGQRMQHHGAAVGVEQ